MNHEKIRPFENTRMAKLLSKQIDHLKSRKSQLEIAREMGYRMPNIISMMKNGDTKVPIDKAIQLAKVLELDPFLMLRLALEQSMPEETHRDLMKMFGNVCTGNEMEWIQKIREITDNSDPELLPQLAAGLEKLLKKENKSSSVAG